MNSRQIFLLCIAILITSALACSVIGNASQDEQTDSPLALTITANDQILTQLANQPPNPEPTVPWIIFPTDAQISPQSTLTSQDAAGLSDIFDSVDFTQSWIIYRPDSERWDLTSKRGFLHIRGTKKSPQGYINVFALKTTNGDIDVTAKVYGGFTEETHGAWIGFSPSDYSDTHQTVMVSLDYYGFGYRVNMWECRSGSFCVETNNIGYEKFDNQAPDKKHRYSGYIYLRVVRVGKDYTGYWSLDGKNWEFLAKATDFPVITDQVILGAGCTHCINDFDAYFSNVTLNIINKK
jgi:hypothetical protein